MTTAVPTSTRPVGRSRSRVVSVLATCALAFAWAGSGQANAQDEPPFNRGLSAACSSEAQTHEVFAPEVSPGVHAAAINCIAYHGITLGQPAEDGTAVFAPRDAVTREQMASFIARMMARGGTELPVGDAEPFPDVSAAHTDNVERLRAAGVVEGRADGTFDGRDHVTREQMASFIARSLEAVTGDTLPSATVFEDRGAAVHAANVDKLTAIGVVEGRADGTYGPQDDITREQMASFLARGMDYLAEQGVYDDEVEPLPGTPSIDQRSQDASDGARIAVTDVSVASHTGFDRIALSIDGDGTAGWDIRYVDEATSPGSGEPISTEGTTQLYISVDGAAYPADLPAGIAPYDGGPVTLGGQAVVEVVPDTIFEGRHDLVAGTTGEQPFVVGHVDGDVVIDVFHAG